MNKLLVATLLLIGSGLSHADQSNYVLSNDKELCEIAGLVATIALESHQIGEDKNILLDHINESQEIPSMKKAYLKTLVNEASNKALYSSKDEMFSTIIKLYDDTYEDCMKKHQSS